MVEVGHEVDESVGDESVEDGERFGYSSGRSIRHSGRGERPYEILECHSCQGVETTRYSANWTEIIDFFLNSRMTR